ncbi:DUF6328 family protein [Mycolicibacterium sp. CBM1]
MDVDHPEADQRWNAAARSETEAERLDRNWSSLLQGLRVRTDCCFDNTKLRPLMSAAHRFAIAGLLLLGAALTGVVAVVFGTVLGDSAGGLAAIATAAAMLAAWVAFPLWLRHLRS